MKDGFQISIETWHKPGRATIENVHGLKPDLLKQREVINIDIAADKIEPKVRFTTWQSRSRCLHIPTIQDYKPQYDPLKFKSTKTGRGPLVPGKWQVRQTGCARSIPHSHRTPSHS